MHSPGLAEHQAVRRTHQNVDFFSPLRLVVYLFCLLTSLTEEMQQCAKVVLKMAFRLPRPANLEGHLLDADVFIGEPCPTPKRYNREVKF